MDILEFAGIRFSEKAISERNSNGKPLVWVPKEEVLRVRLLWTTESKHPILQTLFGLVVMCLGGLAVRLVLHGPGGRFSLYSVGMMALVPVGGYIIYKALHRRPVLYILTRLKHQRLVFETNADLHAIVEFVEEACQENGYHLEINLPVQEWQPVD